MQLLKLHFNRSKIATPSGWIVQKKRVDELHKKLRRWCVKTGSECFVALNSVHLAFVRNDKFSVQKYRFKQTYKFSITTFMYPSYIRNCLKDMTYIDLNWMKQTLMMMAELLNQQQKNILNEHDSLENMAFFSLLRMFPKRKSIYTAPIIKPLWEFFHSYV